MKQTTAMNYNQAIDYLYSLTSLGWKLGLNKIRSLLNELDNPQDKYKVIHVAGTNGKGSTSTMLVSILKSAGYKTGLFTSPHLVFVGERIQINNNMINREELSEYIQRLQPLFKKYKCTFFEALTAIGFLYFADHKIDIAVVEVGLGGRLDSTNVVNPILSLITNINLDHEKHLGNTRKSIAKEKAGIIKPNSICITNSQSKSANRVFEQICLERQVEHISISQLLKIDNLVLNENFSKFDLAINGSLYPQLQLNLSGLHQIQNAALAVTAANIINARYLPIQVGHIYQGLNEVRWPGRLQLLNTNPKIVVDVAHNPAGMISLKKSIKTIFKYKHLILLLGIVKNKNYQSMIRQIAPMADLLIAVKIDNSRSLSPTILAKTARQYHAHVKSFRSVEEGLCFALKNAQHDDLVLGTGSHFTVGEIIQRLGKT